jgi:hypothetical protein
MTLQRNRRLSYTAPKFSQFSPNAKKFNDLMNFKKMPKIAVIIDWFSVLFTHPEGAIPTPPGEAEEFTHTLQNSKLTLHYTGKGQQHYKYIWHINFNGEHLATLLSHTRNDKFVRKNNCKIDFKNHLLYSSQLWPFYDLILKELNLTYKNISRLDIAIDGVNYLQKFMNLYVKQDADQKVVEFKGKPSINANILDKKTMFYQHFRIGSKGGKKVAVIYNKSLDIVKTRKEYIQKYWLQNGIIEQLTDLEQLAKALDKSAEKTYLEGFNNIYRFELRIKGERIKEIENFSLQLLKTPDGLISIVKLLTRQFFDAFWLDNANTARCTPVNLLPFDQFEIIPLDKIELLERGDLYKTKLSINKNVRQLYTGKLNPDNAAVFEMLKFDIELYDLKKWTERKLSDEWQKQYSAQQPNKEYLIEVNEFFETLLAEINE